MQGRNKRDRLRYSVAVSIKRAENHNSKFKPWSFAKVWRIVMDTKAREAKVDCTADEFNEMVEKFKEPFKPYWTPCIELFLW